jgi:hypothetical protein
MSRLDGGIDPITAVVIDVEGRRRSRCDEESKQD